MIPLHAPKKRERENEFEFHILNPVCSKMHVGFVSIVPTPSICMPKGEIAKIFHFSLKRNSTKAKI